MYDFFTNILSGALSFIIPGGAFIQPALASVGTNIVEAAHNALYAIFTILPTGGNLPPGAHDAAIYFGNALQKVNFIMPVDVLVSCLVLLMGTKMMMYGFHIAYVFANWIRGLPTPRFAGIALPGGEASPGGQGRKFWGDARDLPWE